MNVVEPGSSYPSQLDGERQPSSPSGQLTYVGIDSTHESTVDADEGGRAVPEDSFVLLAAFQIAVARGKRERGVLSGLADDLLADRVVDAGVGVVVRPRLPS